MIQDADVEEELDVDVAVIGLGVSGVAAFRAAAEAGANVVAFEKGSIPSVRSTQYAYVNGSKRDFYGIPEFDLDEIVNDEFTSCASASNYSIVRRWALESADAFDWWCAGDDELYYAQAGETITMDPPTYLDPNHPNCVHYISNPETDYHNENQASYPWVLRLSDHQHVVDANLQKGVDAGGQTYFGHFAESLIMDDSGRCIGVYVRNAETGGYKKVMASSGVILSCGDCGSNEDMMRAFFPQVVESGNGNPWPNVDVEGNRTNTGDGFRMGYWAGAAFAKYPAPMIHVMGGPGDSDDLGASSGVTAPFLRLNYNGKRFQNEDVPATECDYAFAMQPQTKAFMICDSHMEEQQASCVCDMGIMPLSYFDESAGNGVIYKGETLEELFASIEGMDEEAALESVQRYNELCKQGVDEDFGKKAKYLFPVEDGPFYAQRMGLGLCLTTMGLLCSDADAHVLNSEREPIPGLYVSGNAQGDRFAVKYPFKLSGSSHSMAMFYGKVAGENAAAGK